MNAPRQPLLITNATTHNGTGTNEHPWLVASFRCKNGLYRSVFIDQHEDHIRPYVILRCSNGGGHKEQRADALAYTSALFDVGLTPESAETERLAAWFPPTLDLRVYAAVDNAR